MKILKEENIDKKALATKALAKELGLDVTKLTAEEEVTSNGRTYFTIETEDGERYVVADHDAAEELAKEDVESVVDDLGIESFTKDYQQRIFDNFANNDDFKEAFEESYRSYAEDIKSEDDDKYESRLVRELVEMKVLSDDDLVKNDEGLLALKDDADEDDLVEKFIDAIAGDWNYDYVGWMKSDFGLDEVTRFAKENNAIDWDAVYDDVIDTDGIAHFVASYNGKELKLDDDFYAYRID